MLVVLVQGKWTSRDSWFAAVFASAVMAMVIDLRQLHQLAGEMFRRFSAAVATSRATAREISSCRVDIPVKNSIIHPPR